MKRKSLLTTSAQYGHTVQPPGTVCPHTKLYSPLQSAIFCHREIQFRGRLNFRGGETLYLQENSFRWTQFSWGRKLKFLGRKNPLPTNPYRELFSFTCHAPIVHKRRPHGF